MKDEGKWPSVSWKLKGITAEMLDWWFCNLDKGFLLWHPKDHKGFEWIKKPVGHSVIGAIHVAPQVWDGNEITPYIRWEDVSNLSDDLKGLLKYDHVLVAACISLTEADFREDNPPISYRIHQWEKTDFGVRGTSYAISLIPEAPETIKAWMKHSREEMTNLGRFLPSLFKIWQVVKDPNANPFFCFRIEHKGDKIRYAQQAKS